MMIVKIALAIFILGMIIFGLLMAFFGIKARNEDDVGRKHWPPPGAS